MSTGPSPTEAVSRSMARRVRDVLASMSRADAFVSAGRPTVGGETPDDDVREAVHALLLRSLRVFADPYANRMLGLLGAQGAGSVSGLAVCLSVPRALAWELVNDLVQVGLAERDPTGGEVVLTRGGAELLGLLDELVDSTVARVATSPTPSSAVVS